VNPFELLKAFLQVPELSDVGTPNERAAFIALRLEGCTVREASQAIGVSKSHVPNLADLFQAKLTKRMKQLGRKGIAACSAEYQSLHQQLLDLTPFEHDWSAHKVGRFEPAKTSQEDWAEIRGMSVISDDE
jgi:transposase